MSFRKTCAAGLLVGVLGSTPTVRAQVPGAPTGGAAPPVAGAPAAVPAVPVAAVPVAAAPAAVPAAAAAPRTLWGFLGLSKANIHACIAKLCGTQFGQMANNLATGPVGAVSGGFIPPLCPAVPSPAQIAALEQMAPGGAAATAAKIKASEADAKARVAAVEYLGTVDCTRWKEATKALIISLRADPNECVRWAAARVLNSGCCCNKDTIEALKICVAGEDKDGNPPETSLRVKAAAFSALQNCLMRVPEVLPEEAGPRPIERERGPVPELEPSPGLQPLPRERSTMSDGRETHLATSLPAAGVAAPGFEARMRRRTLTQTVNEARQTLVDVSRTTRPPSTLPPGKRSVFDALIRARQDVDAKSRTASPAASPPADPGVVPSAYTPGTRPGRAPASTAPRATAPSSSSAIRGGVMSPRPASESQRSLLGLLLGPRDQRTDQ